MADQGYLGALLDGADMRWKYSHADSDDLDSKVRDEKIEIDLKNFKTNCNGAAFMLTIAPPFERHPTAVG